MFPLKSLYAFVPPERLSALACKHQVDATHSVKLSGPVLFLCLLNGLLNHPELTQRLLEETYHQQTGQTLDHSTFGKCLKKMPAAYFADLFAELHQKMEPTIVPATKRALKLRFVDATTVTLSAKLLHWGLLTKTCAPDKTRRHIKSVIELSREGLPNLLRVCQEPSESADSVALGATMKPLSRPNDLWVFDKGCHGRERLLAIAEEEAFWLTPLSQQHVQVQQILFSLPNECQPTRVPSPQEAIWVTVGVEQVVFQNSQVSPATLAKWGAMPLVLVHGLRFDTRSQTWKELILMTNLPLSSDAERVGPYTWDELAAVYAQRWDIEVFFKFIKQHLSYSHLTSRCENGIKIMIYMSLIAALLLIWHRKQTGINRGWRSVKFWLAENVRSWTKEVLPTVRWIADG
jgi:hypothetical protein